MNQAQICEILTSVQAMRLDALQPHKAYPILRVEELYVYGSEHGSYCIFGTMYLGMVM